MQAHDALRNALVGYYNPLGYLGDMLQETRSFRGALEREVDQR